MPLPADRTDSPSDLRDLVERAASALHAQPATTRQTASATRSPKEVLGLLIDVASATHKRLLWAWEHESLAFDGFVEEPWGESYEEADWSSLVTLWWMYATHLLRTAESIPGALRHRPHQRHTLDELAWRPVPADAPATIDALLHDFGSHLRHHLALLLPDEVRNVPSSPKDR